MTDRPYLARTERLTLAGAAIRGILAGATRAVIDWVITQLGQ
jgi:hypothetical protein